MPKEKSSKASALYSLARNIGGSIGISVLASFVARHQQMHQNEMVRNLLSSESVYRSTLASYANAISSHGLTPLSATAAATGRLYQELLRQATIIAYRDSFATMAVVISVLAAGALLMPRNNPHSRKSSEAMAAH